MPLPIATGVTSKSSKAPAKKAGPAVPRSAGPAPQAAPSIQRSLTQPTSPTLGSSALAGAINLGAASGFGQQFDAAGQYVNSGATSYTPQGYTPQGYQAPQLGAPQGYTPAQYAPRLIDPNQINSLFDQNPAAQQQYVGGNVDEAIKAQAMRRKEALQQKLAQLDQGYKEASDQIHGGYQAVGQLLAGASGNYNAGMAPVQASQQAANADVAGSNSAVSGLLAQILGSQGAGGSVGGAQAAEATGAQQQAAMAAGQQAAQGFTQQAGTTNAFFAGLPALAAMGEAGGVSRLGLMQLLARNQTTSASTDAGLAAEDQLRQQDLAYRRSLSQDNTQADRARADQRLQAFLSAITGNNSLVNDAGQYNATNKTAAAAAGASATNQVSAANVGYQENSLRFGAESGGQALRFGAESNNRAKEFGITNDMQRRSLQIQTTNYLMEAEARAKEAQAKLVGVGAKPEDIAQYQDSKSRLTQAISSYYATNVPAKLAAPVAIVDPATKKKTSGTILDAEGVVNGNLYAEWSAATKGTAGDLITYMAAQTALGRMTAAQAQQSLRMMAPYVAKEAQSTTLATGSGTENLSAANTQAGIDKIRAEMTKQYEGLLSGGLGPTVAGYDATGKLVSAQELYAEGWLGPEGFDKMQAKWDGVMREAAASPAAPGFNPTTAGSSTPVTTAPVDQYAPGGYANGYGFKPRNVPAKKAQSKKKP